MDWLDLLAVQKTIKGLLQHHSSKASILWHSAFPIVQLSHPYMTTGKTIALTRWTFVGKVLSLLFLNLCILIGGYLLYNIVVVLPYIDMNQPRVHTCSPSWAPLPPPSHHIPQGHPSAPAPENPVSCIEPRLAIHFTYDNIHVSMLVNQIIPPSSSPTESKRPFYTSMSFLLSHI